MVAPGVDWGQAIVLNGGIADAHFSWTEWNVHPDVVLLVVALLTAYGVAWRHLAPKPAPPASKRSAWLFITGVLAIYLASGTPLHDLGERYLFSAHMTQHMMLTLVAPPFLIAGMPPWMLRPLLRPARVMQAARFLVHPLVAFSLFNAVTVVTHLPIVVDASLRNHLLHFVVHGILVVTAIQMWWLVFSPLRELPALGEPWRMGYLFLQLLLPTVPASFLTFSGEAMYDVYASAPRLWGTSAVGDQQVAGLIMKIGGGLLIWAIITVLFFRWFEEEERVAHGLLTRPDAEKELERMGMTKG